MESEPYISNHKLKDNIELVEIAFFRKKKYEKAAIESAKTIIEERGLSVEEVDALKILIRKKIKQERRDRLKEKREGRHYWDWLMEFFFGFWINLFE